MGKSSAIVAWVLLPGITYEKHASDGQEWPSYGLLQGHQVLEQFDSLAVTELIE